MKSINNAVTNHINTYIIHLKEYIKLNLGLVDLFKSMKYISASLVISEHTDFALNCLVI